METDGNHFYGLYFFINSSNSPTLPHTHTYTQAQYLTHRGPAEKFSDGAETIWKMEAKHEPESVASAVHGSVMTRA